MAQQKPIPRSTLNITLSPSHHVYLRLCAMRDLASVAETVRRIIDREMERELRRPVRPEDLDRFREETERLRAAYQADVPEWFDQSHPPEDPSRG